VICNREEISESNQMGDQIARAEEFEKKAEKKLSGWGLFGSKYEDAADLFDKAANSFKLGKSCIIILHLYISLIVVVVVCFFFF
jgi:hypothetical protein